MNYFYGAGRFSASGQTLQAYYSLVARELENEMVPLCLDQGLGILPWSPLAGGFLTGKYRRGKPRPEGARTPEQLSDLLKTTDWEMTSEEVSRLDAVSEPPRPYPYWMLSVTQKDR